MLMFSVYHITLLNIIGLVFTNPVEPNLPNDKSENSSLDRACYEAEKTLMRYYNLIDSDTDHLVHGILHVLLKNPKTFPFIPHRALNIAFNNMAQKLDSDSVDIITKPLLLTIEQNYQKNFEKSSKLKLPDEIKEKIEEALDKFFNESELYHYS